MSDGSRRIAEIDGDEFAEADYGLVVDSSNGIQDLNQKLDTLAQAALQNQIVSFSTIMKLYGSASIAEKQRLVENDERKLQERQAQQSQMEQQMQEAQLQQRANMEQARLEQTDRINQRDNETRIIVANISHMDDGVTEPEYSQEAKDKLAESIRQFDARLKLDRDKLSLDRHKAEMDVQLKRQALARKSTTSNK